MGAGAAWGCLTLGKTKRFQISLPSERFRSFELIADFSRFRLHMLLAAAQRFDSLRKPGWFLISDLLRTRAARSYKFGGGLISAESLDRRFKTEAALGRPFCIHQQKSRGPSCCRAAGAVGLLGLAGGPNIQSTTTNRSFATCSYVQARPRENMVNGAGRHGLGSAQAEEGSLRGHQLRRP